MTSKELGQEIAQKTSELASIFQKAETGQVDNVTGAPIFNHNVMTKEMIEEVNRREAELADLKQQHTNLRLAEVKNQALQDQRDLQRIERQFVTGGVSADGRGPAMQQKDMLLSDRFLNHVNYKNREISGRRYTMTFDDVDLKTLMTTSAGYAPANNRGPKVVLSAQRRPVVSDLIPSDPTDSTLFKWMEETTFTNQASTVAEGGLKPESALKFDERSQEVVELATWLPVTEEQLDDVAQVRNLIDNRLTLMILLTEENKLLNGPGGGSDILGFLQKSGVQSQAFDTNNADTFFKGMTKVRWTGFADVTGGVMHPDNWQTIRLMKTSGSGEYILGDPQEEISPRLFGVPIVVTPAITANTGLVGDFVMYAHISRKLGLRVDVSDSHDTFFIYNKYAVRAETRLSLEIYRAAAFCKLTSLT